MEKLIRYEELRKFAYSNDRLIRGSIRGVILTFKGLNNGQMDEDSPWDLELAEKGIVRMIPYADPWNWCNDQAVAYTEELLEVLRARYGLPQDLPVVATGGSMGGLCALVYCAKARRAPAACAVNCPVCDLPFHYTEREDLPHTLYNAFFDYDGTLEEALRAHSPLHLAEKLPDIPYTVFHCQEDTLVNIHRHSERFVAAMEKSHRIEYVRVPGRDHCDLDEAALALYRLRAEEGVLKA